MNNLPTSRTRTVTEYLVPGKRKPYRRAWHACVVMAMYAMKARKEARGEAEGKYDNDNDNGPIVFQPDDIRAIERWSRFAYVELTGRPFADAMKRRVRP